MKIVKQCAYCGRVYNLLPAILVTPLYVVCTFDVPQPVDKLRPYHELAGFRLALKFWKFHLGWEVQL